MPLRVVLRCTVDFRFAFPYQQVTDAFQHRHDDVVEQMMSLYIKISSLWSNAKLFQFVLQCDITLLSDWVLPLQGSDAPPHLMAQMDDGIVGVAFLERGQFYYLIEVADSEMPVASVAIVPDAPYEKTENSL